MKKIVFSLILFLSAFVVVADVSIPKNFINKKLIFNSYALKTNGLYNYSKAYSVKFLKDGDKLFLKSSDNELSYSFQILSESSSSIKIEFTEGLTSINFQSSIYKTELDLDHPQLKKYTLPASSFKQVTVLENSPERLFVEVKLDIPGYESITFEIKDDIKKNFKPTLHSQEELVGIYATYPSLSGDLFAAKQSLTTTYLYDESFPEELLAPLRSAVGYWNNALGVNLIRLEKAKDKSQALKIGTHYIDYYADRDDDGGARGIFSLDPESGKILTSYIYVPSGFKVWGTKFFREKYPNSSLDNINQMVLDYLTHTLAHEIGHTLGIRHNFAASTQSNIHQHNFKQIFDRYSKTLEIDEATIPATSSMDYVSIDYFALIGAKMRLGHSALSYDQKAVQWLYLEKPIIEFGNFCTHYDEPPTVNNGGNPYCQAWDEPHLIQ